MTNSFPTLPFTFLSRGLPSTYEGRWGSIQYGIKLIIEKSNDEEVQIPLSVSGMLDLNDEMDLLVSFTAVSICKIFNSNRWLF